MVTTTLRFQHCVIAAVLLGLQCMKPNLQWLWWWSTPVAGNFSTTLIPSQILLAVTITILGIWEDWTKRKQDGFSVIWCQPSSICMRYCKCTSSLHITNRSCWYASPCLCNQFPSSVCQPHSSPSVAVMSVHAPTTSSHCVNSPLSLSRTPSLFHSWLKTYLFHKSFPQQTVFWPWTLWLDHFFWAPRFLPHASKVLFLVPSVTFYGRPA